MVERPSSVLKELIENSLDAGSTVIDITIEGAGRTLLRISDNGSGMTKEEAHLALQRHATSKISKYEDLESVLTFGFRGEALPSMASVSRFRLITKSADSETAWELELEGGKIKTDQPAARETGTTIEVRDLFFNTPARFKFLKSDNTERAQCLKVIEEVVFAAPQVTIRLTLDKAKPIVFSPTGLLPRIAQAWGDRWLKAFEPVASVAPHFSVKGYVSHQAHHQASTRTQVLFVNRRPVTNRRLTRAVYDAYVGQLPQGRHPAWVLFLDVNPQSVDVNVHPTKREVKLAFESELYQFVLVAAREALRKTVSVPSADMMSKNFSSAADYRPSSHFFSPSAPAVMASVDTLYQPLSNQPASAYSAKEPAAADFFVDRGQTEFLGFKDHQLFAVAQVHSMFIVAESNDSLMLVDQHAAAEKVLYEKLLKNMQGEMPAVQMLLVPFNWEVALAIYPLVKDKLAHLQKMGFVMEDFGGDTFLVKGYPSMLGEKFDLHSLLDGMSDVLAEPDDRRGGFERNFEHRLAALTACKAAVKAGDTLDLKSCQYILQELLLCDDPLTCPHGRPTVIRFSTSELERRFRRK